MEFIARIFAYRISGLALAVLLTSFSTRALAETSCWQQENNPHTHAPYQTRQEWAMDVEYWNQKKPAFANPVGLFRAYATYRAELKSLKHLRGDKQAHCFIGCRIAQVTDYKTSIYVAWLKEDRDIKDCNLKTHFEIADFEATVDGARIGAGTTTRRACFQSCQEQF